MRDISIHYLKKTPRLFFLIRRLYYWSRKIFFFKRYQKKRSNRAARYRKLIDGCLGNKINPDYEKISIKIEIDSYINQTEIIHKIKIREFVNSLSNNIYHLDFETYQSAVPPFNGLKPYQQIPFQYSAHYENNGTI